MKKLDVLMLKSFIGPFLLTTAVVDFILLLVYMLKYFDDFVGKNLGFLVFTKLLFYFSLNMLRDALPLGVLLASLMTFGNLGENFELSAIKSSGISLLRTIRSLFIFVIFLSIGVFFFNNYTIPATNLKAYSLLYDIKHTKPALDIKAGTFYNGIPDFSIKAADKLPDGKTLLDVIIYDHSAGRGNKTSIYADSCLMYTIMDDRYLKLELFSGNYYTEEPKPKSEIDRFYRTKYDKMDMVFSLASFDLKRRKEELFRNNRQMKDISELTVDIDSFQTMIVKQKVNIIQTTSRHFEYHLNNKELIQSKGEYVQDSSKSIFKIDSVQEASLFSFFNLIQKLKQSEESKETDKDTIKSVVPKKKPVTVKRPIPIEDRIADSTFFVKKKQKKQRRNKEISGLGIDTLKWVDLEEILENKKHKKKTLYSETLNKARNIKVNLNSSKARIYQFQKDANLYTIEKWKKYAQALACIVMFLIGAPLGAIIKKGGLGVPTILAIFFFIIYYIFTSVGEKQAKENAMNPLLAVWMADMVLFPIGLFFLRQARIDARLFELDSYIIRFVKIKKAINRKIFDLITSDDEKDKEDD